MKNLFDTKVFVTVLIALLLMQILNKLFLNEALNKMLPKKAGSGGESYEAEEFEAEDYEEELV